MKISKAKPQVEKIKMKTKQKVDLQSKGMLAEWWLAEDDEHLAVELCQTAAYLKTNQTYRMRQLGCDIRLYAGLPIYSYAGSNVSRLDRSRTLPDDKPTFNLISSCVDTLLSRITQSEPQPKFLTDGADYRQRHLAQQLNQFILGEFYQTQAYEKGRKMFRDGLVTGTGCLKIFEGDDHKVCVERRLQTNLFFDENGAIDGKPQEMYELALVDRAKLISENPKEKKIIENTPNSYPDNSPDSGRTTSDQIMVVEGWKLPSGPDPEAPGYYPGRHTLATVNGVIFDEPFIKPKFPFVFFHYDDAFMGFWSRGIATRQFGTQLTLNRIMYTISKAITLVGVPRIFQDSRCKVPTAHHNNEIGVIIRGDFSQGKPTYEVAPCNAPEMYEERDRLIQYGFQSEGISSMQATSQKPAGLNSGEAIRSYDDMNTDRFASVAKKYSNVYKELAYLVTDIAMDIAKRDGKYQTVYPNKDGTKEIDLPAMKFLKDPFVIQCFDESSLPRDPAGRKETVTEQVQAGMLTIKEGRRLLRFPDLEQNEKLDNASEERIFKILDMIVEDGKYTAPDAFIDLQLATQLTVQYINLYLAANLEEKKADMLRDWFSACQALIQAAQPPPMPQPMPTANPQPAPTSPLVPNTNAAPQAGAA
jgi:hypothetical protein